jgi:hypothetical protein
MAYNACTCLLYCCDTPPCTSDAATTILHFRHEWYLHVYYCVCALALLIVGPRMACPRLTMGFPEGVLTHMRLHSGLYVPLFWFSYCIPSQTYF